MSHRPMWTFECLLGLIYLLMALRAIATLLRWSREEKMARDLARCTPCEPADCERA